MLTVRLRDRASWKALEQHHAEIGGRHLRELFAEDPGRATLAQSTGVSRARAASTASTS
jgi:glucose-6-phosphate isomerase